MGTHCGPHLNQDRLISAYRPGFENKTLNPDINITLGNEFNIVPYFDLQGVKNQSRDDDSIQSEPSLYLENVSNPNKVFNNKEKYTVSVWLKVKDFPKYMTRNTLADGQRRKKRSSLIRFHYSNVLIEFGAMLPYYYIVGEQADFKQLWQTNPVKSKNYISFGAAVGFLSKPGASNNPWISSSIYSDYKFKIGTWYLLSIEISPPLNYKIPVKFYVNEVNEPTVILQNGFAWKAMWAKRRGRRSGGSVAAWPGFRKIDGSTMSPEYSHYISYDCWFSRANYAYPDFSNLKWVYCSPMTWTNHPSPDSRASLPAFNSGVDFGQIYTYNKVFDKSTYTQFYNLYR